MMWMMRCYGRGDWWQWNIMRRESVDLQMQIMSRAMRQSNSRSCLRFIHTRFKKFCSGVPAKKWPTHGLDKNSYTLLNTIVFKCYELLLKFCLLLWLFFCNARRQRQWRHHHRRVVYRIFLSEPACDRAGFILMSLDQLRGSAVSFFALSTS